MKLRILVFLALCLLLATSAYAQRTSRVTIAPVTGIHFGETSYLFTQQANQDTAIGSELIFPLDFVYAGIDVRYESYVDRRLDWTVAITGKIGLTNPGDPFTDRDWITVNGYLEQNFSYTESEVDVRFYDFYVEATKTIAVNEHLELAVLAGFGYQKIMQDALDFYGAQQLPNDPDAEAILVGYEGLGLLYDVEYLRPQLGLAPRVVLSPSLSIDLKAAGTPFLYIRDKDEHLLRFMRTEADGRGWGFFGRASIVYEPPANNANRKVFVKLTGEFSSLKADLLKTMSWYGDDPGAEVPTTGLVIPGLRHDIRSKQYSVQLQVGAGL